MRVFKKSTISQLRYRTSCIVSKFITNHMTTNSPIDIAEVIDTPYEIFFSLPFIDQNSADNTRRQFYSPYTKSVFLLWLQPVFPSREIGTIQKPSKPKPKTVDENYGADYVGQWLATVPNINLALLWRIFSVDAVTMISNKCPLSLVNKLLVVIFVTQKVSIATE